MAVRKMLRTDQVLERTNLTRGTLYRLIKGGRFPAPRQIGPRLNAWFEDDVERWQEALPEGLRSAESGRELRKAATPETGEARPLRSVPRPSRIAG